jgi:hypothetical protein
MPGDGGVDMPPMICNQAAPPAGTWFVETTAATLPAGVLGTSVRGGDLDGDGYPDLIATVATTSARDTATVRTRFLLMNRPDPGNPANRVFVDTTVESGILATRDGAGGRGFGIANLGDLDGDGDLDVVVCPLTVDATALDPCAAFLNDGTAHFTLAPEGELEDVGVFEAASASLLDFDGDGILDYWPGNFAGPPYLFRGLGDGTFHEVAATVGLPTVDGDPAQSTSFRQTFGVTACDLDGDGDQDVLLADYGREANQVWLNQGGMFTEHAMELGVAWDDDMNYMKDDQSYLCWCQATSATACSLPGDCPSGTMCVLNKCACPMGTPQPITTCPDRGWVVGQSDQPWRLGGNNFSITCGDLDDDGDMDLMTATIRHWDVGEDADPSEILRNDSPAGGSLTKFVRPGNMATGIYRKEVSGWNEGDMMPVFGDVDLDGYKDIFLSSSDYPGDHAWLWHQKTDGTFEDVTAASAAGQDQTHGVALIDVDRDGDLDLVLGTSVARGVAPTNALRFYQNQFAPDANWLQVHLVGSGAGGANRSAIGARVKVTAGGRAMYQEVSGGYGHNAIQNDLVLTFGLGAACAVDEVEVRWPDAAHTVQKAAGVRGNYRIEITQGTDAVRYLTN